MDEWRDTAFLPGLEINRQGEVRNKTTGVIRKHVQHPANPQIPCIVFRARGAQINVLLEETFGPGAAEAVGLPAPDWTRVFASRKRAEERRAGVNTSVRLSRQQQDIAATVAVQKTHIRRCTDCGKPTHNYRCEKCWKKRRGFGFEPNECSTEADREAYGNAVAAARSRKEKVVARPPEIWMPLAPRRPLPDRQAEYFAQKLHHREEPMTQQTYTVTELSNLLGMKRQDICNSQAYRHASPKPGSKNNAVNEAMRARGITWDMVVPSRPKKDEPAAPAASGLEATADALAGTEPQPIPVADGYVPGDGTNDGPLDPKYSYECRACTRQITKDCNGCLYGEMFEAKADAPKAGQLGQAIAKELSTGELEEDAAKRLAGIGPVPGSIGVAMSIEDIIGELRRRLPVGVTLTINAL